jgi:hypothetical protein
MASSVSGILMADAIAPIFLVDDPDVFVYTSLSDAEADIEPLDVQPEGFRTYDSEGKLIRLEVKGSRVLASLAEDQPTHAGDLEIALRNFLEANNDPIAKNPTCDLKCLVNSCRRFIPLTPTVSGAIRAAWYKIIRLFRD